jgi:hypothetical protein
MPFCTCAISIACVYIVCSHAVARYKYKNTLMANTTAAAIVTASTIAIAHTIAIDVTPECYE